MVQFKRTFMALSLGTSLMFLTACGGGGGARVIDPHQDGITTVGELDVQDAVSAAAQLSQSLLNSGVLGRGGKPSIIAVDRFINNTSRQIDRDEVMKKIRVTLNKAGVARTLTSVDSAGNIGGESNFASRKAAKNQKDAKVDAFLNDGPPAKEEFEKAEYSLTFKISDKRVQAGSTRQTTYTFDMSLNNVQSGLADWEESKSITKQGKKASVGW